MDLNNLSIFSMAKAELSYLTERQKVLATNIANANTPDYLPQDIQKPSFSHVLRNSMPMYLTNERHLAGVPVWARGFKLYTPKPDTALTIDGNGVVLEDQLNEASKTKGDYNRVLSLYGKYKTMLHTANTKINA